MYMYIIYMCSCATFQVVDVAMGELPSSKEAWFLPPLVPRQLGNFGRIRPNNILLLSTDFHECTHTETQV